VAGSGRYSGLPIATLTVADGAGGTREVRYWRRRALPAAGATTVLALHAVTTMDRLDLVTDRYLGDSTAFWRVADANPALDPDTLVGPGAEGRILVIPVPRT